MIIRVPLATILGAAVLFGWGYAFWDLLSDRVEVFDPLPNESAVVDGLKDQLTEHGHYYYPMPDPADGDQKRAKSREKHKAGPIVKLTYQPAGSDPMAQETMIRGGVHMLISAFVASILLAMAAGSACCYPVRVFFVLLLGVFTAVWQHGADFVWFQLPQKSALFLAGYDVAGWLLAGIVMAMIIRRKKEPEAEA